MIIDSRNAPAATILHAGQASDGYPWSSTLGSGGTAGTGAAITAPVCIMFCWFCKRACCTIINAGTPATTFLCHSGLPPYAHDAARVAGSYVQRVGLSVGLGRHGGHGCCTDSSPWRPLSLAHLTETAIVLGGIPASGARPYHSGLVFAVIFVIGPNKTNIISISLPSVYNKIFQCLFIL